MWLYFSSFYLTKITKYITNANSLYNRVIYVVIWSRLRNHITRCILSLLGSFVQEPHRKLLQDVLPFQLAYALNGYLHSLTFSCLTIHPRFFNICDPSGSERWKGRESTIDHRERGFGRYSNTKVHRYIRKSNKKYFKNAFFCIFLVFSLQSIVF